MTDQELIDSLVKQLAESQARAAEWNSMYMSICNIHHKREARRDKLIDELKARIKELESK